MRTVILIFLSVFATPHLFAQTQEDSVKKIVQTLFEAMKNADAITLAGTFLDSAILQTIVSDKDGNVKVRNEQVKDFIGFISKEEKGNADERITFEIIKIDGPLAFVWTPYKFYYKGKFSHCGVNSFHLVKLSGQWKIQYLIDTRRKAGCE